MHISFFFLVNDFSLLGARRDDPYHYQISYERENVVMANSKVEALEAESSRLRKDLI